MNRPLLLLLTPAFVAALGITALADKPEKEKAPGDNPAAVVYDADSAFEFLKTLAGNWSPDGEEGDKSSNVFRVSGAGSTVIETIYPGQPSEMVTVYHRDGDDLLLTHYCALWNAPVMKFEESDQPGEIKFAFHGGTNFDPETDSYAHHGSLQVKDADTIEVKFVGYSDGKPGDVNQAILKRKSAE